MTLEQHRTSGKTNAESPREGLTSWSDAGAAAEGSRETAKQVPREPPRPKLCRMLVLHHKVAALGFIISTSNGRRTHAQAATTPFCLETDS